MRRGALPVHHARRYATTRSPPNPSAIRLKKKERRLEVDWNDGRKSCLAAEYLRVYTPSIDALDMDGKRKTISGRKGVGIISLEPVGNYALRILFDDAHDSGICSYDLLRSLDEQKIPLMRDYIKRLRASGKSREPRKLKNVKK